VYMVLEQDPLRVTSRVKTKRGTTSEFGQAMFFPLRRDKKNSSNNNNKKCGDSNWEDTIPLELNGKLDRTLNH
jgi:hypothetical protein